VVLLANPATAMYYPPCEARCYLAHGFANRKSSTSSRRIGGVQSGYHALSSQ
jgi:hypothetical protein